MRLMPSSFHEQSTREPTLPSIGERMALYEPIVHLRLGSVFDHISLPSLPKDERDGAYASFSGI